MSFSTDNCVVPRLYLWQVNDIYVRYQMNWKPLGRVSHQRNSGVIVDETLKPHCQCAKGAKSINSIKTLFMNITPTLFDEFDGTSIRPHFEYSFQVWWPWLKKTFRRPEELRHTCEGNSGQRILRKSPSTKSWFIVMYDGQGRHDIGLYPRFPQACRRVDCLPILYSARHLGHARFYQSADRTWNFF